MRMNLIWGDDVTEAMTRMADLDSIAPEMLQAAAPAAVDALKQQVGKHRSHKAKKHLVDSVKAGKPKKRKRGGYAMEVSFSGYDAGHGSSPSNKKQVAQLQKAVALEYGTSKQTATPFLDAAANSCKDAVTATMTDVLRKRGKL
nr:MAG TPA: hypothetical protein [Caudoviricetes sp.]